MAFSSNFRVNFEPMLAAFSRLCSSCFPLFLVPFGFVLGLESPKRETAGTHAKRSQLQPPGEAAQRASKGISDRIG